MIDNAFKDRHNGDVVNLLSNDAVGYMLTVEFKGEPIIWSAIPCAAVLGCILSDGRGEGAFQK
jgi:hypothetical protein